ncbi:MAG: TetR/AcrR family transcriptional regulator [Ichthyobacteriaceae bacterium]|nr:TetR/AcrR family transcriptional regulator [Ichthyobacteriaceae bacterium]
MLTERQTQIIESSIKLIASKGIQGFTIKNLSRAIGISEPAIYRHFSSKTSILLAILSNFKEIGEAMMFMVNSNLDAIDKIDFIFSSMIDVFIEQPAIISVLFSEEIFKNDDELEQKIVDIQNMHQSNIENIIEIGQNENKIRKDIDKSTFALMFMGSLRLLVKRWDMNKHNFNLKKEGSKLINSLKLITQTQYI